MTWAPAIATATGRPPTAPCGLRCSRGASAPSWKATRAGSGRVPGHRGRARAAGQRRRRRHGADLGSADRRAARRPGRPPGRGHGGVPGHRGRPGAAGQRRRRRHGADLGPADRRAARRPGRPPGLGQGVCPVTVAGRELLASAGDDGTVRIWDPQTGEQRAVLEGHRGGVKPCARSPWPAGSCWPAAATTARCGSGTPDRRAARRPGRPPGRGQRRCARSPWPAGSCWPAPAATARCGSGTRRPASSAPSWKATRAGQGVCPVTVAGRQLLASAGDDRHGADLGPRRPASSAPSWKATRAGSTRVCPVTVAGQRAAGQRRRRRHGADLGPRDRRAARRPGRPPGPGQRRCARSPWPGGELLASGGNDGTVRIWDPGPASSTPSWKATRAGSAAVCPVTVAGRQLLASAGDDGTVRIWDPETGEQRAVLEGHQGTGQGGVPGHRGRAASCWPAPATTARCGSGTRRPASSAPSWKATRAGSARVPGHRGRAGAAGQRRRRRHGADLGSRRPASSAPSWKATRAAVTACARSRWPGGSCWPAPAATARCGSGTPQTGEQRAVLEGHQGGV